jgi:hypothetical protein
MMKSLKLLVVLSMLTVLCLPGMALADYTFSSGYSYIDNYPESGVGAPVNLIDVFISSGAIAFASPAMQAYLGSGYDAYFVGWTGQKLSDTHAQATTGTASGQVFWDYVFAGSKSNPWTIDWNAYSGSEFKLHEHLWADANGAVGGYYDIIPYSDPLSGPAPLPPTVLLLGSGLVGLGLLGRRKVTQA